MSEVTKPVTPAAKRFSFRLVHQAGKGKFSTRRNPNQEVDPANTQTDATPNSEPVQTQPVLAPAEQQDNSPLPTSEPEANPATETRTSPEVSYRSHRIETPGLDVTQAPAEPLAPERIKIDENQFFQAEMGRQELLITASAAKSLTKLFSALAAEPGSGPEIPAPIRTRVLDLLIKESHLLANDLCEIAAGEGGGKVPVYFRAKLLQQSAEFLSQQWAKTNTLDTSALKEMAAHALGGHSDSLTQEVVDLFHVAGEFTPATTKEISQSRITEAVIRASWALLRQVQEFDVRDYDSELPKDLGPQPFSYGRDPYAVAKDLTQIVLSITKENELHLDHLDLATNWKQNSIDRATMLVRTEYRLMTDRALRSSFKEDLYSEAAINKVNDLYDQILDRIGKRARDGFIIVERNALSAMSATSYVHYLPKKQTIEPKESSGKPAPTTVSGKATPAPEPEPEPIATKEENHVQPAPTPPRKKPFSFSRARNS